MQWLRRLVWGRLPQRPGFDRRSVHRRFVVDKVALGQIFLRVRRFHVCQYYSINAPYSYSQRTSVSLCQYYSINAPYSYSQRTSVSLCQYYSINAPYSYSERTSVSLCQYYSINAPYSYLFTCLYSLKDKRAKRGGHSEGNALPEIREYWVERYSHFLFFRGLLGCFHICINYPLRPEINTYNPS